MASSSPLSFLLNPALSFCQVDGRHVFLDSENNRYFCLGEPLEAAFAAFARGGGNADEVIVQLRAANLLVPHENGIAVAACPGTVASASLVDGPLTPERGHYFGLLCSLARTRWLMRRRPLSGLLAQLARARNRCDPHHPGTQVDLKGVAHAFEALSLFATTHNQCLPRSLALAFYLAARGHRPELVFAVRLGPFKAHCWVECDGWIANGRLEEARHYTPILRT